MSEEIKELNKASTEIKVLSKQLNKGKEAVGIKLSTVEEDSEQNKKNRQLLNHFLNQVIDAENLLVLAGSGTSLTFNSLKVEASDKKNEESPNGEKSGKYIAPSMGNLWESCSTDPNFNEVLKIVKYKEVAGTWPDGEEKNDIELLLSLCDTYKSLKNLSKRRQKKIADFVNNAKKTILNETNFIHKVPKDSWSAHNHFIRTLGRRSPKQQRLKLFTTNYDLAFEQAASNTGMIVIDGFEFSSPANFNPSWFQYDVINRNQNNSYLPNLFHLYKLHGSVDWNNKNGLTQKINIENGLPDDPVFIYPSRDKYEISYKSPYIDMISAFLEAVKQPKTALICIGFGFNDDHLNSAITMALRTNPELMLLVVTRSLFGESSSFNPNIKGNLSNAVNAGDSRIMMIDTDFATFSQELLPNRHIQTPEEQLMENFAKILERGSNEQ